MLTLFLVYWLLWLIVSVSLPNITDNQLQSIFKGVLIGTSKAANMSYSFINVVSLCDSTCISKIRWLKQSAVSSNSKSVTTFTIIYY